MFISALRKHRDAFNIIEFLNNGGSQGRNKADRAINSLNNSQKGNNSEK